MEAQSAESAENTLSEIVERCIEMEDRISPDYA